MAIPVTVAFVMDGSQVRKCVTLLIGFRERYFQIVSE